MFHAVEPEVDPTSGDTPEDGGSIDQGRRWLLFLDASDVVRDAVPWIGSTALEDSSIDHWLMVFRDHGQPDRPLPEAKRRLEDDDDAGG
jgi:hypothetical protein